MSKVANVRRRQARRYALRLGRANHHGMLTFPPSLVARIMSPGRSRRVWSAGFDRMGMRREQNRLAAKRRRRLYQQTDGDLGLDLLLDPVD